MSELGSALMDITERPPHIMVAGKGSWLSDSNGRSYLDFVQGWAVNSLGHSPREIAEAAALQAQTLISCSPAYYNGPMLELAQLLTEHSGLHKVFFASSGAEANEGAIKLARKWGAKHRNGAFDIITLQNSFHGRTLATMSASGKPQWEPLFEPKVRGFTKVPINDLESIERAIDANTVAIMLEPIQGEAGVIAADIEYLQALRALATQRGILLILDEVQTGVGRTGELFAFQRAGIEPDIMTLAKGLGGGVPLAALLARREVSCFDHGDQGGTFSGNPLMAAIGCAVFSTIANPAFLRRVRANGEHLQAGLRRLSEELRLGVVRGAGLLQALEIPANDADRIVAQAFKLGLLVNAPRPHVLRFMPALNVSAQEIDTMLDLLRRAIVARSCASSAA
jgi:acetylornithine/N-succinyldiaminopimelate aminotransferase